MPLNPTFKFGWVHNPHEVKRIMGTLTFPIFRSAPGQPGRGAGKTVLLYLAWKEVLGHYFPYPAQTIGCCVSRAYSEAVDLLQCISIAVEKERNVFTPTSHEAVYGYCRVDIGGQKGSNEDGACGAWAAKAISTIGTLSQEAVGFPYDDKVCKQWGTNGVPEQFRDLAKDHLVSTVSLVDTLDELDDSLAGGYPCPVCSQQGFTMKRDQNGFCHPEGSWPHAMLICAVRKDEHPGYCILQSWGANVPSGPTTLDQPDHSFWVEPRVVAKMLQMQDTFAISQHVGYPSQDLPESWTLAGWI